MADHSKQHRRRQYSDACGNAKRSVGSETRRFPLAAATGSRYAAVIVCGFLVLAVGLVFGQTARHQFITFDDSEYIYENPHVSAGLTSESIVWAFTTNRAGNWHPLTWLSHMLDCQMFGLSAGGHHATSAVLHAATAIVLFLTLRKMTGRLWPSAMAAAVFAIHPLRVESVAWAAERKDLLSGLFFALTLAAYVWYSRRSSLLRYLLVAALFACGLMCKPMLVTLPIVLLLLDYWPLQRWSGMSAGNRGSLRARWPLLLEKIPLLVLAAASCVVTTIVQQDAMSTLDIVPLTARVGDSLTAYVVYMGQSLYPVGLANLYPHRGNDLATWFVVAAGLLLLGITVAAIALRRRAPYFMVGWFWYVGMLVPVIGIVTIGNHAHADRYTYLPQIGLSVAIIWGFAEILGRRPRLNRSSGIMATLILTALTCAAWKQTSHWRNSRTIWTRSLQCTSRNYTAHNGLAVALGASGDVNSAIEHLRAAIDINPGFAAAHHNLGMQLAGRGEIDEAIREYQTVLTIDPMHAETHNNLGNIFARRGQLDDAIRHYQQAIEARPEHVRAHFNLGTATYQQGRVAEAIAQWRETIRLEPNFAIALNQLAWVLATSPDSSIRNGREAVALAQRAARVSDPPDAAILGTLAAAYAEVGRFSEAVSTIDRAMSLAAAQDNGQLVQTLRTRRELYRSGSPYRDPSGK